MSDTALLDVFNIEMNPASHRDNEHHEKPTNEPVSEFISFLVKANAIDIDYQKQPGSGLTQSDRTETAFSKEKHVKVQDEEWDPCIQLPPLPLVASHRRPPRRQKNKYQRGIATAIFSKIPIGIRGVHPSNMPPLPPRIANNDGIKSSNSPDQSKSQVSDTVGTAVKDPPRPDWTLEKLAEAIPALGDELSKLPPAVKEAATAGRAASAIRKFVSAMEKMAVEESRYVDITPAKCSRCKSRLWEPCPLCCPILRLDRETCLPMTEAELAAPGEKKGCIVCGADLLLPCPICALSEAVHDSSSRGEISATGTPARDRKMERKKEKKKAKEERKRLMRERGQKDQKTLELEVSYIKDSCKSVACRGKNGQLHGKTRAEGWVVRWSSQFGGVREVGGGAKEAGAG